MTGTHCIAPNGIAYHRSGSGRPVLLVHGVGLRAECWGPQITALRAGNEIIAIDMPGHGNSQRLSHVNPQLSDYSDRIATFIEVEIGGQVVIAGHSMGAMIALDLASRYPGLCAGVAALNAIYRRSDAARQAVEARAALLSIDPGQDISTAPVERWFGTDPAGACVHAADRCRQWLTEADRTGYAQAYSVFAREDGPCNAVLSGLAIPALFLTGGNDRNSTPAMSNAMASRTSRGEAVIIAGAGHMAQLTHDAEVNSALQALLSRADSAPGLQLSGMKGD